MAVSSNLGNPSDWCLFLRPPHEDFYFVDRWTTLGDLSDSIHPSLQNSNSQRNQSLQYLLPVLAVTHDLHGNRRRSSVLLLVAVAENQAACRTTAVVEAGARQHPDERRLAAVTGYTVGDYGRRLSLVGAGSFG